MAYFNRTDLPFYYALAGTCTHLLWHLWHLSLVVALTACSSLLCGAHKGTTPLVMHTSPWWCPLI